MASPRSAFSFTALIGLLLALSLGLAEALTLAAGGFSSGIRGLLLPVALYAPLGGLTGVSLGAILAGIIAHLPPDAPPLRRYLRDHPAADRKLAAGLLAGTLALLLLVALVFSFNLQVAAAMANRRLAALSTGLFAGLGAVLAGLAYFPLAAGARLLARLLGRRPSLLVVLGGLTAAVLATLAILGSMDWRVIRFSPWIMLSLLVGGTALISWRLLRRATRPAPRTLPVLALLVVLGGGLSLATIPLGGSASAVDDALRHGLLLPELIRLGRALGDRDGDGYAAWFNGGDCDDRNPAIHPGARDLPGNGVDENCLGGDARQPARAAAARPQRQASWPSFKGNLLLVCIDTLRADKLGAMGHGGGLTPNMDQLAGRGALFSSAYAQGPNTPQSFPSIFTSRYPPRVPFHKTFTGYPQLKPEAVTLFEALSAAGIHTAAVTSHFYFTDQRGITQGVADWDNRDATNLKDSNKDIASPRVVPRAIAKLQALAASKQRFALFVHLFEPHSTYVKHPQFPITERGVKGLEQKYDFEIKFADLWLGKLLAGLEQAGLADSTAVVVFGDHGEAFGDHKLYFHGQTLYNEVIRVPLIMALPAGQPRVIEQPVALLDLAPTVLELLGVAAPAEFQGASLLPALYGQELPLPPDRPIGAVLMPYPAWPKGQQALIRGRYKAIWQLTDNRFELYDLKTDPREQKDLAASEPQLAQQLRQELARFAEEQLQ